LTCRSSIRWFGYRQIASRPEELEDSTVQSIIDLRLRVPVW
jgi:hypothetical protein